MDRRAFLARGAKTAAGAVAVSGSAGAILAACGTTTAPKAGGGGVTPQKTPGVSTATPKPGGSLIFSNEAEVNGFDPTNSNWDVSGLMYAHTVYDPLMWVDVNGKAVPYLLQSMTPDAANTTWTLTLRPGVVFHDGTPLDAAAVAANIEAEIGSPLVGPALSNLNAVTVKDPNTVIVTTKTAWPALPYYLAGQAGYIALPSTLGKTAKRAPVGTGPFVFKEWTPGDHFTATKNPKYWRSGLPYLDSVTYKPIPDHQQRKNALEAGNIDIMHTDDTQTVVDLKGNSAVVFVDDLANSSGEHEMHFYMINTAKAPLDDVRIRQALAFATDTKTINSTLNNGLTPSSTGPFVPGSPYYTPTGYPEFNLTKAKALVAAYVKDKGPVPVFKLATVTDAKDLEVTQLVQANWAAAGITVQIAQVEQAQHITNALLGNYDVNDWRQFSASDPDENYVWWSIPTAAPIGKLALNFARNKDPQVQTALDMGRSSLDTATRIQQYEAVSKRFGSDVPYIWINQTVWGVAAKPDVQNFNNHTLPSGGPALRFNAGFIGMADIWRG
jgi:peptide/nickel transport system substrate-binding protein